MISSPGNSPSKTKNSAQVPITGIARISTVDEPQAGAGQQVVGQRVAREALDDRR